MSSPVSSVGEEPPYGTDARIFPTFERSFTAEGIRGYEPHDMSSLAMEVGLMLRNICSIPESQISPEERDLNGMMMGRILW